MSQGERVLVEEDSYTGDLEEAGRAVLEIHGCRRSSGARPRPRG